MVDGFAPRFTPCFQEGFVIEGTYHNGEYEVRAPGYFCLSPGTVHGPARSEGHVVLSMLGGSLDITYTD